MEDKLDQAIEKLRQNQESLYRTMEWRNYQLSLLEVELIEKAIDSERILLQAWEKYQSSLSEMGCTETPINLVRPE